MEIGSEFWAEFGIDKTKHNLQVPKWLQLGQDYKLLLSGRTAIDYVIKDIKLRYNVKSAYLPSYCCSSMVKPFIDNNVSVSFYNVKYSEKNGFDYNIDYNKDIDIFLAMNYYGFNISDVKFQVDTFKKNNILVIEDITHSLFNVYKSKADYGIASIRKWLAIPSGAIAINYNDTFINNKTGLSNNVQYINIKLEAMKLKAEYMKFGNNKLKPVFLDKFNEANKILEHEYLGFMMDDISINILNNIDVDDFIKKRKNNMEYIYNNLKETNIIKFVYVNMSTDICPFFVPIVVSKNKRDKLRKYLISNDIYLPVHWGYYPEKFEYKDLNEINETILSLICDQRYDEKEMKYMTTKINDFMSMSI